MEAITITFDEQHGWKVQQGDKYADWLGYDEMMGVVSALTMPKQRPCLQWMRTKEQHEAWERSMKRAAEGSRNQISKLALPVITVK